MTLEANWTDEVIGFWFGLRPEQWWKADETLDSEVRERFEELWQEQRQLPAESFLTDPHRALAAVILFESALSYLGLGVPPETVTLGGMVAGGREAMLAAWWVPALPGAVIALIVLGLNLLGDGLRQQIDPRLRT